MTNQATPRDPWGRYARSDALPSQFPDPAPSPPPLNPRIVQIATAHPEWQVTTAPTTPGYTTGAIVTRTPPARP